MKWKYIGAIIGMMFLTMGCGFGAMVYLVNTMLGYVRGIQFLYVVINVILFGCLLISATMLVACNVIDNYNERRKKTIQR